MKWAHWWADSKTLESVSKKALKGQNIAFPWDDFKTANTRGVQYVMKTVQYIPKFYIYTLYSNFH